MFITETGVYAESVAIAPSHTTPAAGPVHLAELGSQDAPPNIEMFPGRAAELNWSSDNGCTTSPYGNSICTISE